MMFPRCICTIILTVIGSIQCDVVNTGSNPADINNDVLLEGILTKVETFEYVEFNYSLSCERARKILQNSSENEIPSEVQIKFDIRNSNIAKFQSEFESVYYVNCSDGQDQILHGIGGHLGITRMTFGVVKDGNEIEEIGEVQIKVKRAVTALDEIMFFAIGPLILLNKCAFGAKIEISVLKHIFTQPVALCLCLLMQFMAMPLLALLYSKLFSLTQSMALALFVAASCPGGGGGYVFSFLIDGDVTLAISASLLSTVVAMGAMPGVVGLYTYFNNIPENVAIPYGKMVLILCAIAVPISSGMLIKKKWPNFAKQLIKIIHPLSLFLILCGFVYLAVTSKYIQYGPTIGWVLAAVLPLSGFLLSLLFARCIGLSWPFAKAISLESGMKNTVLGIAVIELTYPQPEADLSSILIIMVTLGHTTISLLWYFGYLIREKCCPSEKESVKFTKLEALDDEDDDDDDDVKMEFIALNSK